MRAQEKVLSLLYPNDGSTIDSFILLFMPDSRSRPREYERESEPASSSAPGTIDALLAMPFRARALRDSASAAVSAASARLARTDGSHISGTLKGLWSALAGHEEQESSSERYVLLQPGWAVKRFVRHRENSECLVSHVAHVTDGSDFGIAVFVQGACVVRKDQNSASRTQRAFVSLARRKLEAPACVMLTAGFASLPPMTQLSGQVSGEDCETASRSTDSADSARMSLNHPTSISRAHHNLDARLRPFWSSLVPNHPVIIRISICPSWERIDRATYSESVVITTDTQGYFQQQIEIPSNRVQAALGSLSGFGAATDPVGDRKELQLNLAITADVILETPNDVGGNAQAPLASRSVPKHTTSDHSHGGQSVDTADARNITSNTAIMRVSDPGGVRILSDIVSRRLPILLLFLTLTG